MVELILALLIGVVSVIPIFTLMILSFGPQDLSAAFVLAAPGVPLVTFAIILFPLRWAVRVVVADACARNAREGIVSLPPAARTSVILSVFAALDKAERAEGSLREAVTTLEVDPLAPQAKQHVHEAMEPAIQLIGVRHEMETVSRLRRSRAASNDIIFFS